MAGVWSEESKLARWLDVELAALEAWAELGAIPAAVVAEIRQQARPPAGPDQAEWRDPSLTPTHPGISRLPEKSARVCDGDVPDV